MASRWRVSTAVCALTCVLALGSVAFAATVVKGGSYTGALIPARDGVVLSFKVSANGRKVTGLSSSNLPLYCSGGGPPIPIHFKSASISGKGTFSSTGVYHILEGPKKGQLGAKLKITGKFLAGGKERGTLATNYVGFANCSGKSPYSTKT
ncbi:MAG: hypothetical protein WB998_04385 [Solirubrobacteraceae bacterium]